MSSMSIGQLGRICGLAPSAIRYYEKAGLLPGPNRVNGRRRYGGEAIGRLRLLKLVREVGFSIVETRTFVAGFSARTPPAERWRTLAERKLTEIDGQMRRLRRMKVMLESGSRCRCLSVDDCARMMGAVPSSATRGAAKPRPGDLRSRAPPGSRLRTRRRR